MSHCVFSLNVQEDIELVCKGIIESTRSLDVRYLARAKDVNFYREVSLAKRELVGSSKESDFSREFTCLTSTVARIDDF